MNPMMRKMLRGKIHRAVVTQCDPDYVGSITIDAALLEASGLVPNEAVHVLDIDNAARFETYVILGERGSGVIGINGAAARLVEPGHRVIILAYGWMQDSAIHDHVAQVVVCDQNNGIAESLRYPSRVS